MNRQQKASCIRCISGVCLIGLGFYFLEVFKSSDIVFRQGMFIALWVAGIILLIEAIVGLLEHDV